MCGSYFAKLKYPALQNIADFLKKIARFCPHSNCENAALAAVRTITQLSQTLIDIKHQR